MGWKKDEQPKTVEESFENLLNLTIRKNKQRVIEKGKWTEDEIESVFGQKENIYDFLWQTSSKDNPYYIKILEEGTAGPTGDINRPYYQEVEGAADTMGVFLHKLLEDFDAEATHAYQNQILGDEKFNEVLDDQQELIVSLLETPRNPFTTLEDMMKARNKTYNIPFTEGYNLENLAHGVDGVGGLEQIINALTSTSASEPFGEEEKKNFLNEITNLVERLK